VSEHTTKIYSSTDDWRAEARRRFGDDAMRWKFRCPVCGNIQTPEDFYPFREKGATPDTAAQQCLGRFTGGRKAFGEKPPGTPKRPCDYAAFGLLRINTDIIEIDEKTRTHVFPFADATTEGGAHDTSGN
jgi:hypothetical protein